MWEKSCWNAAPLKKPRLDSDFKSEIWIQIQIQKVQSLVKWIQKKGHHSRTRGWQDDSCSFHSTLLLHASCTTVTDSITVKIRGICWMGIRHSGSRVDLGGEMRECWRHRLRSCRMYKKERWIGLTRGMMQSDIMHTAREGWKGEAPILPADRFSRCNLSHEGVAVSWIVKSTTFVDLTASGMW